MTVTQDRRLGYEHTLDAAEAVAISAGISAELAHRVVRPLAAAAYSAGRHGGAELKVLREIARALTPSPAESPVEPTPAQPKPLEK